VMQRPRARVLLRRVKAPFRPDAWLVAEKA
jgi:hypothetical protein